MADKRIYRISVQRWCGELVCGRVTRDFYEYWRDRNEDSLGDHVADANSEGRDPNVPRDRENRACCGP